ncbi:MAG: alpha/beta hydrolase-fold protein [Acidobacteriota bacterium]
MTSTKKSRRWYSHRVEQEVLMCRWGHFGRPVLLFPTAGGDAEEIERMLMIRVLAPLLEAGKIKVYSIDSLPTRVWNDGESSGRHATWLLNAYHQLIFEEAVPAIRQDCEDDSIEVVSAGASIGAFNALAVACRRPDLFRRAICLSGTYDVDRFIRGRDDEGVPPGDHDYHVSSPLRFLPSLGEGKQIQLLRERLIIFAHGGGRWETPEQDWRMASVLGAQGVPNRVDPWGSDYDHDWPSWRAMMPKYLGEVD